MRHVYYYDYNYYILYRLGAPKKIEYQFKTCPTRYRGLYVCLSIHLSIILFIFYYDYCYYCRWRN
jgi:hypothetical protein